MCPSSQQPCFQSCQLTSLHCPSIHCQPSSPFSSLFCSQVLSKDPKSPPTVARGKHQCELIPEQFEKRVRSAEPAGVLTPTLCHSVTLTLPLGARKSQSQSISPHPAFLTMDSSNSSINNVSFFVLITSMYSPYLLIPWALSSSQGTTSQCQSCDCSQAKEGGVQPGPQSASIAESCVQDWAWTRSQGRGRISIEDRLNGEHYVLWRGALFWKNRGQKAPSMEHMWILAQTMEVGQNRQVRGNNADKDTRTCPALIRANT